MLPYPELVRPKVAKCGCFPAPSAFSLRPSNLLLWALPGNPTDQNSAPCDRWATWGQSESQGYRSPTAPPGAVRTFTLAPTLALCGSSSHASLLPQTGSPPPWPVHAKVPVASYSLLCLSFPSSTASQTLKLCFPLLLVRTVGPGRISTIQGSIDPSLLPFWTTPWWEPQNPP